MPAVAASALAPTSESSLLALQSAAAKSGSTRIIVQMSEGRALPAGAAQVSDAAYAAGVQAAATSLISSVFGSAAVADAKIIDAVPMFAIEATAAQIAQLAADPRVEKIYPDELLKPTLIQSLPIIKMTQPAPAPTPSARPAPAAPWRSSTPASTRPTSSSRAR